MTDKSSPPSATLDAFEKWWKANAYKFPQADYASSSYEEIARAAWEARATTLQNAAPRASSTQDSTRTGDDIGPSARHPTEKETGGAPAVAAPETTVSEIADSPAAKNEGNAALRLLAEVADAMDLSLGDSVSVAKMRPLVLARLESVPSATRQTIIPTEPK